MMTFPPEFTALMAQYRDTAAGLGHDHPLARRLWMLVEATAPESFHQIMHDAGERLYSLDDVAARLGISPDEARREVDRMLAERKALGLPVDGLIADGRTIHRMQ